MPSLSSKLSAEQKLKLILDSLEEKKAIAPEVMDLTGRTLVADYFVVTHGTSDVHIRALSDAVVEAMEEKGGPAGPAGRGLSRQLGAAGLR